MEKRHNCSHFLDSAQDLLGLTQSGSNPPEVTSTVSLALLSLSCNNESF